MVSSKKLVIKDKINSMALKVAKYYHPEKIILFGSWAWGKPKKDSDVDLFIIKKGRKSSLDMMRDIDRILLGRTIPIDILAYTPIQVKKRYCMGDPFLKKILQSGKVLYEARPSPSRPRRRVA
ncbi:MAG: nucleotidyltransferase domain-containing protein [Chlamydiae bacterium]|nr:nucleotidyltransferase domain-containing protein [Chlamydiota bacterium]MBI3276365.1 nucleotidyltransferase domain-containing protein [Chlamydiota bacterium]